MLKQTKTMNKLHNITKIYNTTNFDMKKSYPSNTYQNATENFFAYILDNLTDAEPYNEITRYITNITADLYKNAYPKIIEYLKKRTQDKPDYMTTAEYQEFTNAVKQNDKTVITREIAWEIYENQLNYQDYQQKIFQKMKEDHLITVKNQNNLIIYQTKWTKTI